MLGSPESIQLFEEGLSYPILANVMRAPTISRYYAIKERAMQCYSSKKASGKANSWKEPPLYPIPKPKTKL
jgi:hypothetical protein